MEVISDYIETVFIHFPQTDEINALKNNMLQNLEEKYENLLAEGITKEEAIGIIITEFGDVTELQEEILSNTFSCDEQIGEQVRTLSSETIKQYLSVRREVGLLIGIGVVFSGITISSLIYSVMYSNLLIILLTVVLTGISVVLFIIGGFRINRFSFLEKQFILTDKDRNYLKMEKELFEKSFILSIVTGVLLCIFSLFPVVLLCLNRLSLTSSMSLMLLMSTVGSFLFIYSGNIQGGFNYLLNEGIEEGLSVENIESKLYWKKFNEKYWLIILLSYLVLGFFFNKWGTGWIIFPIAGIVSSFWNNK